jgi:4-aminobutyrate aminotransferase
MLLSWAVTSADTAKGGTYSGNVVACAAALATTRYMRSHDILGNVRDRSEQIFKGLREIQADHNGGGWMIEEVRGKGVRSSTSPWTRC